MSLQENGRRPRLLFFPFLNRHGEIVTRLVDPKNGVEIGRMFQVNPKMRSKLHEIVGEKPKQSALAIWIRGLLNLDV